LHDNELAVILASAYNITPTSITPVRGGCSAKAYRVAGADGVEYFVKEYDSSLPTTRVFVERSDSYMPVLHWLSESKALRGRVLAPVQTRRGAYKVEAGNAVYTLFLYVRGEVPGVGGMTAAQTAELAETLALLHAAGTTIPFEMPGLREDVSLPFCDRLMRFLNAMGAEHGALYERIAPHAEMLRAAIGESLRLRDAVRLGYAPLSLCHGDAHGNNVIQSERLVLADWEDLRVAPAEADLFICAWHKHGSALLAAYSSARPGYRVNRELLGFYVLRRRIEDVWFDVQRLTEEDPDEAEAAKLLDGMSESVGEVLAALRADISTKGE